MQRIFPFLRDKGTLNVGAPADIAILELRQGHVSLYSGNYSYYIDKRKELLEHQGKAYNNQQKKSFKQRSLLKDLEQKIQKQNKYKAESNI